MKFVLTKLNEKKNRCSFLQTIKSVFVVCNRFGCEHEKKHFRQHNDFLVPPRNEQNEIQKEREKKQIKLNEP